MHIYAQHWWHLPSEGLQNRIHGSKVIWCNQAYKFRGVKESKKNPEVIREADRQKRWYLDSIFQNIHFSSPHYCMVIFGSCYNSHVWLHNMADPHFKLSSWAKHNVNMNINCHKQTHPLFFQTNKGCMQIIDEILTN